MVTLVTGADGFVGSVLCERLLSERKPTRGAVRVLGAHQYDQKYVEIGGISSETNWSAALKDVQQIVHLAARAHVIHDDAAGSLAKFRSVNVQGTACLARQAAAAGVKRFVFISSIKVHGESTETGFPFNASQRPAPADSYGISKYEAEQLLRDIARDTGMEVVIIRPPLIYGPGVKANFASMMSWLTRGLPLPLAAVTNNRRSLVALDNLIDLIVTCLTHPAAANQTFLVSDGEDLSTAELLRRMGNALGRPAKLFYLPPSWLKLGATMINKFGVYQRLCGSLQVDISETCELLNWRPPVLVDEGLRRTAQGFVQ